MDGYGLVRWTGFPRVPNYQSNIFTQAGSTDTNI